MQDISILGCGWLGFPLAETLLNKGYHIKGTTTKVEKLTTLKSVGIVPYLVDIHSKSLNTKFLDSDILIILITSKNVDAFKQLIKHIEASRIKNVIFISSTSVYPNTNTVVTEESQTKSSPLVDIENLFLNNKTFKSSIIRFGGLFGYGRKPGNFIRSHNTIPNPEGFINLIHQDDCINIINAIIEKNIWGETLNACSNSHPKRSDFYIKEMAKVGRLHPILDPESANDYKIVNPEKLISLLNFTFKY
ncbi:NAD(P)-binding domain-containing protein [Formosa sp. PL04]|uniref:NAD(P)-binding domain-containing protein n=1 Tax=Formosa sp. PL04 TaxID=3081755 RepID=UPI002980D587|nr:NAD(P)-binding domain-containing protein [Formosa sp. PL04]MDW5287561.1 NAD(P)-binding domain-containing protein [Formosa sp. PL04]